MPWLLARQCHEHAMVVVQHSGDVGTPWSQCGEVESRAPAAWRGGLLKHHGRNTTRQGHEKAMVVVLQGRVASTLWSWRVRAESPEWHSSAGRGVVVGTPLSWWMLLLARCGRGEARRIFQHAMDA